MYTLTKLDIVAFRQADDIVVHLSKHYPDGIVYLMKRKDRSKDPLAEDIRHTIACEVGLTGWLTTSHYKPDILSGAKRWERQGPRLDQRRDQSALRHWRFLRTDFA